MKYDDYDKLTMEQAMKQQANKKFEAKLKQFKADMALQKYTLTVPIDLVFKLEVGSRKLDELDGEVRSGVNCYPQYATEVELKFKDKTLSREMQKLLRFSAGRVIRGACSDIVGLKPEAKKRYEKLSGQAAKLGEMAREIGK